MTKTPETREHLPFRPLIDSEFCFHLFFKNICCPRESASNTLVLAYCEMCLHQNKAGFCRVLINSVLLNILCLDPILER